MSTIKCLKISLAVHFLIRTSHKSADNLTKVVLEGLGVDYVEKCRKRIFISTAFKTKNRPSIHQTMWITLFLWWITVYECVQKRCFSLSYAFDIIRAFNIWMWITWLS